MRPASQGPLERGRLDPVVERRGGPMRAHHVDVRGRDARVGERGADGPLEATSLWLRRRDVEAVAGAAVAQQRAEPRAPRVALAHEQGERAGLAQ